MTWDDGSAYLQELAPGVYAYVQPAGGWMVNNCGVITDGSGDAVLVDTTSTEKRNRALLAEVAGVAARDPKIAVNTHHHPDHTYGNGFLPGEHDDLRAPPVPRGRAACPAQGDPRAAGRLRRPGRPAAGRDLRPGRDAAPRRVPGRAAGDGSGALHQRRRCVAARAEGHVRRRPGVLGWSPDLPRRLARRLPVRGPADARPRPGGAAARSRPGLPWRRGGQGPRRPRGLRRLDRRARARSRTPPA